MGKIIDDSLVLLELGLSASATDEERAIVQQCVVKAEGAVIRFLHYSPVQVSAIEYYPMQDFSPSNRAGTWEVEGESAVYRRIAAASGDELQLSRLPVRAFPAIDLRISYDGKFGSNSTAFAVADKKTEGSDYWPQYDSVDSSGYKVCSDGILRSFGRWPSEPGSVRVEYTAGYSLEELQGQDDLVDASPIMDAVIEESLRRAKKVLTLWKKNARTGHNAGTITGEGLGEYNYSISGGVMDKLMAAGAMAAETKEKLHPFVNWGIQL